MTRSRTRRHPVARAFDRVAASYERGRPDYAPAAVRFAARTLGLRPGRTIVELGAGTGKLTRDLLPFGATVVAVEPSAAMRAEFDRAVPLGLVVPGLAEALPLPDRLADGAIAAQAFHWFRPRATGRELLRVVRPGGAVVLLWNVRDRRSPFVRRLEAIVDRSTPRVPGRWRTWKRAFRPPVRGFGPVRRREFRRVRPTRPDEFVHHVLSVSRVGLLPPAERRKVAREVRRLVRTDPLARGRRRVALPMITEVYWTRRRGSLGTIGARRRRRRSRTRRSGRTSSG